MIYAVISDIHANLSALKRVLEDAKSQGAEHIICLGDVTGYGPSPAETLALLLESGATIIAGNHDDAVSGRVDGDDFIDLAHDAVIRHRDALSPKDRNFLASRSYTATFGEAVASHGDFTDPANFLYIESEDDAEANFEAENSQIAFVGHTHTPEIFLTGQSGKVYRLEPQDFTIEDDKRYIVNPGSVGYPREKNGQCFSSYVIYDSEERSVSFRFLPFEVSSVMQRGKSPKQIKKRFLVAGALGICAAVAISAWILVPKEAVTVNTVNVTEVVEDPELFIRDAVLKTEPGKGYVSAQLVLDTKAKSAPVDMEIKYLASDESEIESITTTVKSYSKKVFELSREKLAKTSKIVITLRKQKREDNVIIKEFNPRLSASD